jgi:hypothetical protein
VVCSHEEDLYQSVLNTHEERSKALMVENEDLRRCLTVVNKELENTLHALGAAPGRVSSEVGSSLTILYFIDLAKNEQFLSRGKLVIVYIVFMVNIHNETRPKILNCNKDYHFSMSRYAATSLGLLSKLVQLTITNLNIYFRIKLVLYVVNICRARVFGRQ